MTKTTPEPITFTHFDAKGSFIPVDCLLPNPLNPRPWSEEYQARVYPEKVQDLEKRIRREGFDLRQALIVRPLGGGLYRIVVGHHRWAGGKAAGMTSIPCFIDVEMTDEEEAIAVIDNQGREVELWCQAEHAYYCCSIGYSDGKTMTQEEYASLRNREARTVGYWIVAYRVKLKTQHLGGEMTVRAARDISSLHEDDWVWFTQLCLERGWEGKSRRDAVDAVKAINIPEEFHNWLDPLFWKREAAIEAAEAPAPQAVTNITRWVNAAQRELKSLPIERPIWRIVNDEPQLEHLNLRTKFLDELAKIYNPNETKIRQLANQVLESLKPIDAIYKQWLDEQKSSESRRLAEEAATQARLEMEVEFAPKGHIMTEAEFTDSFSGGGGRMDAIFMQSLPRLEDPDELGAFLDAVHFELKDGGVFICLCNPADAFILYNELMVSLFTQLLEPLTWLRRDPKPQERLQSAYQTVMVAKRGEQSPYFNLEALQDRYPRQETFTDVLDFVSDHGTLAEFLLTAYVPNGGLILELFSKSVPVTCAAKRLGYKAEWIESTDATFTLSEAQIEGTPYHWEII